VDERLASIIIKHHLPKRLFPELIEFADFARSATDYDYVESTYDTVLKRMESSYANVCGGPVLSDVVNVRNHAPMHVFRFDFRKQAERLLRNPKLTRGSLWQYSDNVHSPTGEHIYGDLNTGDFWKRGDDYVKARLSRNAGIVVSDGLPHYYAPVLLFIDSTLCDRIGRLKAEPVLVSLGNIPGAARRTPDAWFVLGYIPPYPKSSQERTSDRNSVETKHLFQEYYQTCLSSILHDLEALDNSEDGVLTFVEGVGWVHLHYKLSIIIGDTLGHDTVCGHFSGYASNVKRPCRMCDVSTLSLDKADSEFSPIVAQDIKKTIEESIATIEANVHGTVTRARDSLMDISQARVVPYLLRAFDFCGKPSGVFGACPYESLHVLLLGLMKYLLDYTYNQEDLPANFVHWARSSNRRDDARPTLPSSLKEIVDKAELEARFRLLTMSARRQSDRDMPKTPFKNGVTDLTCLNGQEYPGLILLTAFAIRGALPTHTLEKEVVRVLFQSLSLHDMLGQESYSVSTVRILQSRTKLFLQNFKRLVEPHRLAHSECGLRLVKFHAMLHFSLQIFEYGCPLNTFGGPLEHCLKGKVKQPTARTTKRQDRLALDLCNRQRDSYLAEASDRTWKGRLDSLRSTRQSARTRRFRPNHSLSSPTREDDTSTRTDKPAGYRPGAVRFSVTQDHESGVWSTHCRVRVFDFPGRTVYPDLTAPVMTQDSVEVNANPWVQCAVDKALSLGFRQVDFAFSCDVPRNNDAAAQSTRLGKPLHDSFRCSPSFHSYPYLKRPWFDWAIIQWDTGPNAAKVLLWAKFDDGSRKQAPKLFVVVHPLTKTEAKADSIAFFAKIDKLAENIQCVEAKTVKETAFVLPTARYRTNTFPRSVEEATWFMVVPPRNEWADIGWDDGLCFLCNDLSY